MYDRGLVRRALLSVRVLFHALRRWGVRGAYGRLVRMLRSRDAARARTAADRAFDAERNVDTAAWVRTPDLVTDSPNRELAIRYQPSSREEFALLMDKLDVRHEDFVFVDYGSGKGKVLLMAAEYPFKRIVGVEFSEPLDRIARQNVQSLGADAARVETLVLDATEFEPPSEPLVLYFFHPFELPVMRRVLARVRASLEREPRPAYVVVTGPPALSDAIEEAGFAPVDVDALGWMTRGVFASAPSGAPASV
jgi:hypothetical protein